MTERIRLGAPLPTAPTGFDAGILGLEDVYAGEKHGPLLQSLGFVVQMPVILLLACSPWALFIGLCLLRLEDSGEALWLSVVAGDSNLWVNKNKTVGRGDPQNFWHVEQETATMKNYGSYSITKQKGNHYD